MWILFNSAPSAPGWTVGDHGIQVALCLYPMGTVKGRLTMHMDYTEEISEKGSWPDGHGFAATARK